MLKEEDSSSLDLSQVEFTKVSGRVTERLVVASGPTALHPPTATQTIEGTSGVERNISDRLSGPFAPKSLTTSRDWTNPGPTRPSYPSGTTFEKSDGNIGLST